MSQQALPIWTPAWPTWMEMHSRIVAVLRLQSRWRRGGEEVIIQAKCLAGTVKCRNRRTRRTGSQLIQTLRALTSPWVSSKFCRCPGPALQPSLRIPHYSVLASGICIQSTGLPEIGQSAQRHLCRQAARAHSRREPRFGVSGSWVRFSA